METADKAKRTMFGQRNEPHRVIIACGERVRSFTIRPWFTSVALATALLLITGYLGATAYLVFRDQLNASANELGRQARTAYEDRIANLRAQNDRIASRQLIDRKSYEEKITLLLARQRKLDQRQDRITTVIDRAAESGLALAYAPQPESKPQFANVAMDPQSARDGLGGETLLLNNGAGPSGLRGSDISHLFNVTGAKQSAWAVVENNDGMAAMDKVSTTLSRMDTQTSAVLDAIAVSAERRIDRIEDITAPLGVELVEPDEAAGGLFVPLNADSFDARVDRADRAITRLAALRRAIETLPVAQPVPRAKTTSRFGPRLDPFLRRPAMHTGIDLKAEYGTAVRATAAGTVASAGRSGGYGLMVKIDHGNGIVTRYAHLSRIRVAKGTRVPVGQIIGNIGTSGRSTGPHLHYETRLRGTPRDPAEFFDAGEKLTASLK